ncbi:MAG: nucleotidyltransferase domain-containing protein [Oscillospiraceae bacterium]|nr:nucleotidyltransferase domain-containing protein [Oscillospiraceae bacterium]
MTQTSDTRVNEVIKKVIKAAQDTLGDRLDRVILFGSYARGDFDSESDIDFLIIAHVSQEEANKRRGDIRKRLPGIDIEYDLTVCLHVTGAEVFNRFQNILPFYQSVLREGVLLNA